MDEEVENLRLKVAQKIAENASIEAELAETETKIALLIKNRLSIEEVYHQSITCGPSTTTTSAYFKKLKKSATLGRPQVAFEDSSTLFTMKILDKETRHRSNEPGSKEIEKIILEIFGCAQTCYEEYLLLNVLKQSINLQVSHVSALDDFWKINPSFIKLGVQCSRGPKEQESLRQLFRPLISKILEDGLLSLETDPNFIAKADSRIDESDALQKLSESEVQKILKKNTKVLIQLTQTFLEAIQQKIIPFSIRCIAMELKNQLNMKFPDSKNEILKIIGNFIFHHYISPAIMSPEEFAIVETQVSTAQRKNLAELSKILHRISMLNLTSMDHIPELQEFISKSHDHFRKFLNDASETESPEEHFGELYHLNIAENKNPFILICPNDIFYLQDILHEYASDMGLKDDDPLKILLDRIGPSPPPSEGGKKAICLRLLTALPAETYETESCKIRQLLNETKRLVLIVSKLQSGSGLREMLEKPLKDSEIESFICCKNEPISAKIANKWRDHVDLGVTPLLQKGCSNVTICKQSSEAESSAWQNFVDLGPGVNTLPRGEKKFNTLSRTTVASIATLSPSYEQGRASDKLSLEILFNGPIRIENLNEIRTTVDACKLRALENLARLEEAEIVFANDGYQTILNMIANV
ncbi:hypothetical protein HDU83_008123 [Entophlyctis luteolus]|nr:hypothetical protein HDU83_008123 [Entophlyctis luteolus]